MEISTLPTQAEIPDLSNLIQPLRDASRKLAREWGFLRPTFAGSPLSPAAVHCLIEIGDHNIRRFSHLCSELKIPRPQLEQLLSDLVTSGKIATTSPEDDSGEAEPSYALTPAGAETLSAINAYAQKQVATALATAPPDAASDIITAFRIYAAALEQARLSEAVVVTPDITRPPSPEQVVAISPPPPPPPPAPAVRIEAGYRTGILARAMEMHMGYYPDKNGWGLEFESAMGSYLADFLTRLENPCNGAWSAVKTVPAQEAGSSAAERIVGVVFVDGEKSGREDVARIRAFFVDDSTRGQGVGKRLFGAAMDFVRERGFQGCRLTTMRVLSAARKLYEAEGFKEVSETWKNEFGVDMMVLEYEWSREDVV